MFKSKRVACYLNGFGGHGDDNENKELKLVFHITPIEQELAHEISPNLADRLFRRNLSDVRGEFEKDWIPAREITKASFSSVAIQMQNIEFHELPDADVNMGVMVSSAAISNLRAAKPHPESLNFRLEFDVVVPMDGITMRLVEKYYKATCFLTMEPIQRDIEYSKDDDAKVQIEASLQDAADAPAEEEAPKKKRGRKGKEAASGDLEPAA